MKKRTGSTFLGRGAAGAACLALAILAAASAFAAGPSMMAGFPLRAGANVMLMWMPFPGATSYNVYRGTAPGGPYQKLVEVPMNMHTDMNVPTDKSFYYVVKAVVGGKEGDPSAEVSMKGLEPMVTPKFIGDLLTPDNKLAIRWEANTKAAFYNLYRSLDEKGEYALLSSVQDSKYTDGTVELGKTYHYKVTAVSSSNVESPKADKPLTVKVEKKVLEGDAVAVAMVPINIKQVNTYDVDGQVILRSARDMTVLPDGSFLVGDGRGFLHYVDKDQKFLRFVGEPPADFKGDWGFLTGVEYDPKTKEVYVAYANIGTVRVFDLEGRLLRTLTVPRPDPKIAPNQGFRPSAFDVALGVDGTLWVVDAEYFMVVGLDPKTGKEIKRAEGLGRAHPDREKEKDLRSLVQPTYLAVSPKTGNFYVVQGGTSRVTAFNKAGDFLFHMGGRGGAPGKMQIPASIYVNAEGTIYVGDRNAGTTQAFDETGKYKGTFVFPKKEDPVAKIRTAVGTNGMGQHGKNLFYSDNLGERVVVYEFLPQ